MSASEAAARRGAEMLRDSGYKGGGEVKVARRVAVRTVKKALREHENAEHGGKHEHLKLKRGGTVQGKEAECRPDRRARGGAMKGKIGTVNIKVGSGGGEALQAEQQGRQEGMALGAKMAAAAPHPMPPPGPPPGPGGPPMAGPPPGMHKRGGAVPADDERHEGTEFEPPKQPAAKAGKNTDAIPGNLEKPKGKNAYTETADEEEGRKRGGGVPANLEKHSGTEFEPPAKKRGGKC